MSGILDALSTLQQWTGNPSPTQTILAVLAAAITADVVYSLWFHPLAHIPGPFFSRISGLSRALRYLDGNENLKDYNLHQKYGISEPRMSWLIRVLRRIGPVVRADRDTVIFNDPKWIPLVYHRKSDRPYSIVTEFFGIIGIVDHNIHAQARKRLAPSFTLTNIRKLRPIVEELVELWIDKLKLKAEEKKTFDFSFWTGFLTYDVLGSLCFGEPLGFIENTQDVGNVIRGFGEALMPLGTLIRLPWFTKFLVDNGGRWLFAPTTKDKKGLGVVMRVRSYERCGDYSGRC